MKPRLSVLGLMAFVLATGVGVAAMRRPSELWASAIFTAALTIHLIGLLGVAYRKGRRRAFWAGYSLFGVGYLLMSFGPFLDSHVRPPPLLTTKLLDSTFLFRMGADRPFDTTLPIPPAAGGRYRHVLVVAKGGLVSSESTLRVGHGLAAVAFALLGGYTARSLVAETPAERGESDPNPSARTGTPIT